MYLRKVGIGHSRRLGYVLTAVVAVVAGAAVFESYGDSSKSTFRGVSWAFGDDGRITDIVDSDDGVPHTVQKPPTLTTRAVVREFHGEEGWGVLDGPAIPGGCWVFFSDIEGTGFRTLYAGQPVSLEYEDLVALYGTGAELDGFRYRATSVEP